jgi:hypothetical protein
MHMCRPHVKLEKSITIFFIKETIVETKKELVFYKSRDRD